MSDEDTQIDEDAIATLRDRLAEIEAVLEEAETEADLDDIESQLADLSSDVSELESPEEDEEDDDDGDDPIETLESDIESVEGEIDEQRGPYASDVIDDITSEQSTITGTRWTDTGESSLEDSVETFTEDVNEILDSDVSLGEGDGTDRLATVLDSVVSAIESAELDPDTDAESIEALLSSTDDLSAGVESAQRWSDLTVREQLDYEGYYDVLDHIKDFPPEWHALKIHEKNGNVDMVLLALETMDSAFMEEHCIDALARMGPVEAIDPMLEMAEKRNRPAIEVLGKIGESDPDVVETLLEYVDADNDPLLQKVTFRSLGEIGAEDAVQPIANKLLVEDPEIRSAAARALGLIGDTRTIDPLADVLDGDEDDTVRASAAWALNQIGTERSLEIVSDYTDDTAYLVQAEAERAI